MMRENPRNSSECREVIIDFEASCDSMSVRLCLVGEGMGIHE